MLSDFMARLCELPRGYSEGRFGGRPYGVTVDVAANGRRWKLFARDLSGRDIVSFNLYILSDGALLLKPCEMSRKKVVDFVLAYKPRVNGDAE